jgi:hypothetical protein
MAKQAYALITGDAKNTIKSQVKILLDHEVSVEEIYDTVDEAELIWQEEERKRKESNATS